MSDYHFEYDATHKVLAVRVTGQFTDDVFKRFYAETPRYVTGRDVRGAILDLSAVQTFDLSAGAVHQMAALHPLVPDPTPRYVVTSQDHVFGMARMFQTIADGRDALYIVRSLAAAYSALGITTPQFERLPKLPELG